MRRVETGDSFPNIQIDHTSILEILQDRGLAELGDSYVNFVFSLALSKGKSRPQGAKVPGEVLRRALREAGLRSHLPRRTDRHAQANAAEALLVYAWLKGITSLDHTLRILEEKIDEPASAFAEILTDIIDSLGDDL